MTTTTDLTGPRTIPGLTTAGHTDEQWRVHKAQLINWGGFHGYHPLDFDEGATLLTGASGTGKSTLLDAYIDLMMPTSVAFNDASNDNTTGRARSAEQRNRLSYARGKTNETRTDDSTSTQEIVLRGANGQSVWSAIAFTWRHDNGDMLTAVRLILAPGTATTPNDVHAWTAIAPGYFNVRLLEPFAKHAFNARKVNAAHPEFVFYKTYTSFITVIQQRLGIGRGGSGDAALRLMARNQAGKQFASVDRLYQDMVLDRPETFEKADKALAHYTNLEASYQQMKDAQAQIAALAGIVDIHTRYLNALTEADLIDTYKVTESKDDETAPTAFNHWAATREADLLEAHESALSATRAKAVADRNAADEGIATTTVQIEENQRAQREHGGDRLAAMNAEIEVEQAKITTARTKYTQFVSTVDQALDLAPTTEADFDAATHAATVFLTTVKDTRETLNANADTARTALLALSEQINPLVTERAFYASRRNLVPAHLVEARDAFAAAAGVNPDDLPFVAELLDMDPAYENWRTAADLVLGAFARTVLVDKNITNFQSRIDSVRSRVRLNYQRVDTTTPHVTLHEDTLAGRLVFAENSPFTGWLSTQVKNRFDHLCVDSPADFAPDRVRRVTLSGQVSDGDRGAHGGHGNTRLIGFSPEARIRELDQEIADLETARVTARRTLADADGAVRSLQALDMAHQFVLMTSWTTIDYFSLMVRRDALIEDRDALLAASDQLAVLQEQGVALDSRRGEFYTAKSAAVLALQAADAEYAKTTDRTDRVKDTLDALTDAPAAHLSDAQATHLDRLVAENELDLTIETFARTRTKLLRALDLALGSATQAVRDNQTTLEAKFATFQNRWPDPNRGVTVRSYPDYADILTRLETDGLATSADAFATAVIGWTGDDLLLLAQAYNEARATIRERLDPINEILADLDFGPGKDRLSIAARDQRDSLVKEFTRQLADGARAATTLTIDEVEARFLLIRTFMDRIKPGSPERNRLLDVRQHIHVEAVVRDTDGNLLAILDNLGGKSGGESQELIAFIVGAALRYQLGDRDKSCPTYAPVFLDEGFTKADPEYTGRAVMAWKGLGFQLIVGSPFGNVSGIEPHMDRIIEMTKVNHYTFPIDITDDRARLTVTT